jgi:hypothetical protein
MDNEKFNPIPHTREDDAKLFADPAFKAAWNALEEEYAALGEMLNARKDAGLTQEAVALRMGTTKSAVCRLEGSLRNEKGSPSFATLRKYAHACGKKLIVQMV